MQQKRIYLAAPYWHHCEIIRAHRVQLATQEAAHIMDEGHLVFSPLTHGHDIAKCGIPAEFAFWEAHCLSFIEHWATEVHVLEIEGWAVSQGVKVETALAHKLCLPVYLRKMDVRLEALHG